MKEQMRRLKKVEICFLQVAAGYRVPDRKHKDIKEELGIIYINSVKKDTQKKYLENLQRMLENHILKLLKSR
jgi:hypothetical protein